MSIVKKLRTYAHLTQADLAKRLNVSRTTVTMWENGNRLPDYETVKSLSSFFSISTDFIIGSGVFKNWDAILENKESVYKDLRSKIPADYMASGDDKYLIAKLDTMFWYAFDEIELARWFSYAVSHVDIQNGNAKVSFTKEFQAVISSHCAPAFRSGTMIPVLGDVAAGIPIEAVENIVDYEEIDQAMAATGDYFGLRIKGSSMEPRIREGDVVIVRKQSDVDTGDTAIVLVNGDSATCKRIKKDEDGSIWLLPNNPAYEARHFSPSEIQSTPVSIIGKVVELRAKF